MKYDTQVIDVDMDRDEIMRESLGVAAGTLAKGHVVALPTETVYGLGANALDPDAVEKIFMAKGRPSDNPLIVHIGKVQEMESLVRHIPVASGKLMEAFWPGPLTIILPKTPKVPSITTGGLDTVAIRMPAHPIALRLLEVCGFPIAAPSANRSGRPSPTTARHVYEDMEGRIPLILDGGKSEVGVESTVVDMTRSRPVILRPGGITYEMLEKVLGDVEVDPSVLEPVNKGQKVRSPGMKYTHYSPSAKVIIVSGELDPMVRKISRMYDQYEGKGKKTGILATHETMDRYVGKRVKLAGSRRDPGTIASSLFACFREFDEEGVDVILAEAISTEDMGLAVMNRMARAAGFCIEEA
jgi:L-threonylcarbamoyladenylate synthase